WLSPDRKPLPLHCRNFRKQPSEYCISSSDLWKTPCFPRGSPHFSVVRRYGFRLPPGHPSVLLPADHPFRSQQDRSSFPLQSPGSSQTPSVRSAHTLQPPRSLHFPEGSKSSPPCCSLRHSWR